MFYMSISAYDKTEEQYLSNDAEYVVKTYSELVYRIAISQSGDRHDADDIFGEVFLTYFKKEKHFTEEEHRKAWLIRTTLIISKRWRSNKYRRSVTSLEEIPETSVAFEYEHESDIWNALLSLPPKYRLVLTLYYFEEMSANEIGKCIHANRNAVYTRLSRARKMMRERLEELGYK